MSGAAPRAGAGRGRWRRWSRAATEGRRWAGGRREPLFGFGKAVPPTRASRGRGAVAAPQARERWRLVCVSANRPPRGARVPGPKAGAPATQPRGPALAGLWRQPGLLSPSWASLKRDLRLSSSSPSLRSSEAAALPLPPRPQRWEPRSPTRGGVGLVPKLARPAQPPRRLLPALGATLSGRDRPRRAPQLSLLACPCPGREPDPADLGCLHGLGQAAPGAWPTRRPPGGPGARARAFG